MFDDTITIADYDNDGRPIPAVDEGAEAQEAYDAFLDRLALEQAEDYEAAQRALDIANSEARSSRAALLNSYLKTA